MLVYPRCPACNGELPVKELFRAAADRWEYLESGVGLQCPSCFARLKPRQWRLAVAQVAILAIMALLIGLFRPLIGSHGPAVILFVIGLSVGVFAANLLLCQRLTRFKIVPDDGSLGYPLGDVESRRAEIVTRRAERAARAAKRSEVAEAEARGDFEPLTADWRCDACGEESSPEIKICWNCGASAPERLLGHLKS